MIVMQAFQRGECTVEVRAAFSRLQILTCKFLGGGGQAAQAQRVLEGTSIWLFADLPAGRILSTFESQVVISCPCVGWHLKVNFG